MLLFLIGPMCSGKTTVGRALAQAVGVPWIDLDRALEQRLGPLVPFFAQHGENAFREEERKALAAVIAEGGERVVSCGGGTPMAYDNMERMLAAGTVMELFLPVDLLVDRCARKGTDRPLLLGAKGDELRRRVEDLHATRAPVYARAHHSVRADVPVEEVVQRALAALRWGQER